jgi:hypothetical protein
MKNIVWRARSSFLLYLYQYLVLIVIAIILYSYTSSIIYLPVVVLIALLIDAKTMRYELTAKSFFISGSLFHRESDTVSLKDIIGLHVIDAKPWSFFSLGTVLLITDYSQDSHPCAKAIINPYGLASKIEMLAIKQGAEL